MGSNHAIDDFSLELGAASEIGLALSIAIMMFAVALNLTPKKFGFLKHAPKPFILGVIGQLLGLPMLTLTLCLLLEPAPSVALGMILVACCPGGNVSNVLTLMAKGNAALSVSMTAFSSVAAALITPLAILFWSGLYPPTASLLSEISFNRLDFVLQTLLILALPLLLGMLCQAYRPTLASRLRRPLVWLSVMMLGAIIVAGLTRYWSDFLTIGLGIIGLVIIHHASALLLGNGLARLGRLQTADRRSLSFEISIQNSGLGIVILLTQIGGFGGAFAVAGLWGTWHILAGLLLVLLFRRFSWL